MGGVRWGLIDKVNGCNKVILLQLEDLIDFDWFPCPDVDVLKCHKFSLGEWHCACVYLCVHVGYDTYNSTFTNK